MNSLSYLSRQFDVLASASAPSTPPSTPTGEHFPLLSDSNSTHNTLSHPPLKRTRTWSARSFFIPTPKDSNGPSHTCPTSFPPRSRKRSGSTPTSIRLPLRPPAGIFSLATSTASDMNSTYASSSNDLAATRLASTPTQTIQPKLSDPSSTISWLGRIYLVRIFVLLIHWLWVVWDGLVRSVRHVPPGDQLEFTAETDGDTSGDEKESESDSAITVKASARPELASASNPSQFYVRSRTSSIVSIVLPPHTKPPTPSPLSQSTVPSTPSVHLIPPDTPEPERNQQSPSSLLTPSSSPSSPSLSHEHSTTMVARSSPPPLAKMRPFHTRKTLVLDLDETLIHSTTRPLSPPGGPNGFFGLGNLIGFGHNRKAGHIVEVVMGGRSTLYHVYKRPFADYFLRKVSAWYTLVIFTASMREYADPVIDWLDAGRGILSLRFFREHCTQMPNGSYSKDLSILNEDLSRICLVDNSPVSYSINQANGIPIEGWTHDPSDEALLDLLPVLDSLRFTSDVRHILGLRGF